MWNHFRTDRRHHRQRCRLLPGPSDAFLRNSVKEAPDPICRIFTSSALPPFIPEVPGLSGIISSRRPPPGRSFWWPRVISHPCRPFWRMSALHLRCLWLDVNSWADSSSSSPPSVSEPTVIWLLPAIHCFLWLLSRLFLYLWVLAVSFICVCRISLTFIMLRMAFINFTSNLSSIIKWLTVIFNWLKETLESHKELLFSSKSNWQETGK